MHFAHCYEDAKRAHATSTARAFGWGLSGMWYFAREKVPGGVPGLRWRGFAARPRPSGFVGREVQVPRAVASRLHIGSIVE